MSIEWSINTHKSLPSTQDALKRSVHETPDLQEGYAVLAEEQTNGYGRHGRTWKGAEGNLYLSFLLRPSKTIVKPAQIALVCGLALAQAIRNSTARFDDLILKWPNDILINNKKCAGILIEGVDDGFIVGMGVNINSKPFDDASYVNEYTNSTMTVETFCWAFLEIFDEFYTDWLNKGFSSFRDMFITRTYPKGTHIGVNIDKHRVTGKFDDIDKDGSLILLCDETGNLRKITSGDVFLM